MKKITLLIILSLGGFSTTVFAQSSAGASVCATIFTPIHISNKSDLDFGSIATNGGSGTVVLGADNSGTRMSSSNISISNTTGDATAARFIVTGNAAYRVTMSSTEVLIYNGSQSMLVDGFTYSASTSLSDGKEIIYLGATLHLNDGQSLGTYSSLGSGIKVTVNYN
jgi:hypothetical protein